MPFQRGQTAPSTAFQPGRSGNPGGRPKTRAWTEAYNRIAQKPIGDVLKISRSRTLPTLEVQAAKALLRTGTETRALVEVTDRMQGKEPQAHELGGLEGERLVDEARIAARIIELQAKAKKGGG